METALIAPAKYFFLFIPTILFSILIPLAGIVVFTYIMAIRMAPLVKAAPDQRSDRIPQRIYNVLRIWLAQYRQPRYMLAGVVHIVIFAGFLILSVRSCSLVIICIFPDFVMPGFDGVAGHADHAALALAVDFRDGACVIVKHGNPCGAAEADDDVTAWDRALAADPVSAFGGVVAVRGTVERTLAERLTSLFLEVVVAEGFDDGVDREEQRVGPERHDAALAGPSPGSADQAAQTTTGSRSMRWPGRPS